ncbi:MAG: M48 family metallopeptidase [Thermodesulfobacteriota bacterium]
MNGMAVLILCAVLLHALIEWMADRLNLSFLSPALPDGFRDVYDADQYARSQRYLRQRTFLGRLSTLVELTAFLAFWFWGGFGWLDEQVRALGWSPVGSGLVYIGLLAGAGSLMGLPFSWYGTFVIEARFGFNRTTPRLFIVDRLKALALALVLGAPLLAGILAFFEYAGPRAWLWCWLTVSAVLLILQVIVPAWIMPLFNRFSPLDDGELKEAVMDLARRNRFPLANVFVMDGSRRSAKSNAFFAGIGAKKRLVLFDTLIRQHPPEEIVAIVAHEIGHCKKRHLPVMTAVSILQTGLMLYLLSWFISWPPLFEAFFVERPSVYAGLVLFSLLYGVIDFFAGLVMLHVSRRHEYAADRFAAEATGRPEVMTAALKRLSRDNLSNLTPHPFYVFLHYSHPPVADRIRALLQA